MWVAAGRDAEGASFIVTAPIGDTFVRSLFVYDTHGGLRSTIQLPAGLKPPFVVAAGDFDSSQRGDEIAVTIANHSAEQSSGIIFYDADGQYLDVIRFTSPGSGAVRLES